MWIWGKVFSRDCGDTTDQSSVILPFKVDRVYWPLPVTSLQGYTQRPQTYFYYLPSQLYRKVEFLHFILETKDWLRAKLMFSAWMWAFFPFCPTQCSFASNSQQKHGRLEDGFDSWVGWKKKTLQSRANMTNNVTPLPPWTVACSSTAWNKTTATPVYSYSGLKSIMPNSTQIMHNKVK